MAGENRAGMPEISFENSDFSIDDVCLLVVEEHANRPSRFEITFTDPEFSLWPKSKRLIGTEVRIELDQHGTFQAKCWGRRVAFGETQDQSTQVVIWGYDDTFKLTRPKRLRSLKPGNLKVAIEQVTGKISAQVDHPFAGRLASSDAQFVQYHESDFEFLLRMGHISGAYLWPFRGKLFFGKGPGAGAVSEVAFGADESVVTSLQLNEDWAESNFGHAFPATAAPFEKSPLLDESDSQPSSYDGSDGERASKLLSECPALFPSGYAFSGGDQSQANKQLLALEGQQRELGTITFQGPAPPGVQLGGKLSVARRGNPLVSEVLVTGLRHYCAGGVRTTVVQYGRPGDFILPAIDVRPARQLWPAVVKGEYQQKRARIKVLPCGWHADSEPLFARILSGSTARSFEWLHCPLKDEFVLIGFEGGNPDCPVVVGSLFDAESLTVENDGPSFHARTPGGKVTLKVAENGFDILLEELSAALSAKSMQIITATEDLQIESASDVTISAKNYINLKKK